jgi:hypothetical protein
VYWSVPLGFQRSQTRMGKCRLLASDWQSVTLLAGVQAIGFTGSRVGMTPGQQNALRFRLPSARMCIPATTFTSPTWMPRTRRPWLRG